MSRPFQDPYNTQPYYNNSYGGGYTGGDDYNPYNNASFSAPGVRRQPTMETQTLASRYSDDNVPPVGTAASSQNMLRKTATSQTLTAGPRVSEKSNVPGGISAWRKTQRGGMWNRGSRGRCIGRFFCCTLLIVILLFVSILLSLALWIRPPLVQFNGVVPNSNGSTFESTTSNQFKINLGFNIFVDNPNYFSIDFSSVKATITYPDVNNINVGGGQQNNLVFHSGDATNFTFPFSFVYDKSLDPGQALIQDLVTKCGFFDASQKQDLKIKYAINLKLKLVLFSIGPTISGDANFACPITSEQIKVFLAGLGITIPGI